MILQKLMDSGREGIAFILSRYFYRMGMPSLDDSEYDQLESWIRENKYEQYVEYLNRSYDDDPVPHKLLSVLGIKEPDSGITPEIYSYLEDEKSNSIKAIHSYEEAFEFISNNRGKRIMFSLKLDGVNKKMLWKDGRFILSLSRGRASNSINYTAGSKYVVPRHLDLDGLVKVTGECFVTKSALPKLREKYGADKYKTSKSSAISMLRVEHDREDYADLNVMAFNLEGKHFETVHEMYEYLETIGFKTPPHFTKECIPGTFTEFKEWLDAEVLEPLHEASDGLPSDGVVMEVDDLTGVYKEDHQYSDRQVAIKFGPWEFEQLVGTITEIVTTQKRVYKSVRIRIEPLRSSDGCSAEYINCFNPSILIQNDLRVGTHVHFERNSGAVNILVHGKRLEELTGGKSDEC